MTRLVNIYGFSSETPQLLSDSDSAPIEQSAPCKGIPKWLSSFIDFICLCWSDEDSTGELDRNIHEEGDRA